MNKKVMIPKHICGPPDSGNGGYVVGLMSQPLNFSAEVTLRAPPPLNKELDLVKHEDGFNLMDGDQILANSKPITLNIDIPTPPTLTEARLAREKFIGFKHHNYPTCFVCGPDKKVGEGLRIFTGTLGGDNSHYAATWIPDESFKGAGNKVERIFTASSLDCPGFFAMNYDGPALLARMSIHVWGDVDVGEECIVSAWKINHKGRKLFSGTALYNEKAKLIGVASALWITI